MNDTSNFDWDVLIVGRSFAGLSAALTSGRARRATLVVGSGGPRNEAVLHAHGLLTRDGASPTELVAIAEAELATYPSVQLVDDRVMAIEAVGSGFRATVGKRTVTAAAVILATGVNDNPPDVPGLAAHWGRGVFTCPYCDGFEHQDLALAVLGAAGIAPHTSKLLTGWSDDVAVYGHEFEPEVLADLVGHGVVVEPAAVTKVVGDGGSVSALELADGRNVPVGAIFLAQMPTPNNGLAVALGCAVDDLGYVTVDEMQATTVPGVWAAGDLTTMRHQMAAAIAAGGMAAAASHMSSLR